MRPTLRCVLLFAAGIPVALLPSLFPARLALAWVAYLALALFAAGSDLILCPSRRRMRVSLDVPGTIFIGDPEPLTLEVEFEMGGARGAVEAVADLDAEFEPQPLLSIAIPERGPARAAIPLVPRRRGTFAVRAVHLRWQGPLGLVSRQSREEVGRRVAVVPNVRAVRSAALRIFGKRDYLSGLRKERYPGDGSEFDELREYVPGMDHRAIDWKSSARHRKALCRQFRAERNHQVVLAFDTGRLMREPLSGVPKLDHAINAGLLLAWYSLRSGDRAGLYAFDAEPRAFVEPQSGAAAFRRIQAATSGLDYSLAETNFTLGLTTLLSRLRRRSLVVVLTDFTDSVTAELLVENLGRLARRHLVLFVALRDPAPEELAAREPRTLDDLYRSVVASDFVREREGVLLRLRRAGIRPIDAPPAEIAVSLVNRYLDVQRRELV
jgi:uncharacterized protein (DUF58 family)